MKMLEYEKLLWNKDQLGPHDQRRLAKLDHRDAARADKVANWWVPEIIGSWLLLMFYLGALIWS